MQRRFQSGCLFKRGKRRKVWIGRWREPQKMADGSMGAVMRSEILGAVAELSKTAAQNLLLAKLAPVNSGMVRPGSVLAFKDFACEWEKAVLSMYRPSTREFYKATMDRWVLPYWSEWRLIDIRLMDVRKWLSSHTAAYSASVVKHMRATLSKMLSDAVELGYLDRNPAKGFRTPRGKSVRRVVALSLEQIVVVLSRLDEPLRTAVRLVGILGLRESELSGLRACDLDFLGKTVMVRQSRYRGESSEVKTEGSARVLPLPVSCETALRKLADATPGADGLLFRGPDGKPLNFDGAVKYIFRPLADAAKLPRFTWRSFRRAVSTEMHRDGVPLKVAQVILGHTTPQVTLGIYTETSLDDMRAAVKGLEAGLFPSVPNLQNGCKLGMVN
jgi:integrase